MLRVLSKLSTRGHRGLRVIGSGFSCMPMQSPTFLVKYWKEFVDVIDADDGHET